VARMVLAWGRMPPAVRRRALAAALMMLMLGAAAALVAAGRWPAPRPAVKNVVVLCIDTLRADHMSAYGYRRATTPRLAALARRGVLFEHASAAAPWTVPSVASLLTSLYPGEHGAGVAGEVRHLDEQTPAQLRPEVETLGDILHAAGFRTALLSGNPYLWGRFQRGFDTAVADHRTAGELTDRAIAWLRREPRKPFFLYLQYMDLHSRSRHPRPTRAISRSPWAGSAAASTPTGASTGRATSPTPSSAASGRTRSPSTTAPSSTSTPRSGACSTPSPGSAGAATRWSSSPPTTARSSGTTPRPSARWAATRAASGASGTGTRSSRSSSTCRSWSPAPAGRTAGGCPAA